MMLEGLFRGRRFDSERQAVIRSGYRESSTGSACGAFLRYGLPHRAAGRPGPVQEVFLRLLRIEHHETIRSSEAYLYTVAFHVLHQHFLRRSAMPEAGDITALITKWRSAPQSDPAKQGGTTAAARGTPGRPRAAFRRKPRPFSSCTGATAYSTRKKFGARIGISRAMAAK